MKEPIEILNDVRQDLLSNISFYEQGSNSSDATLRLWYNAKLQQSTQLLEKHFPEEWQKYMREHLPRFNLESKVENFLNS